MARRDLDPSSALSAAVRKLERLVQRHPELARELGEVRDLVESARRKGPSGRVNQYVVEATPRGELLSEYRPGRSAPFRISRHVYDAVVQGLARADRPLDFEELLAKVGEQLANPAPSFQIRAVTRYWLSLKPPLITRLRSRYYPSDVRKFKAGAEQAWSAAAT